MKISKVLGWCSFVFLFVLGGCSQSDFHLVKELAEKGDADSQLKLGRLYAEGDVVPEDAAEAVKWYGLAAEQGQSDAQVWLGMAYETGKGVPTDKVEAYAWFDVASASFKNAEVRRDGVKALLSGSEVALAESRATEFSEKYGNGQ
jgi:uncharacterized protein